MNDIKISELRIGNFVTTRTEKPSDIHNSPMRVEEIYKRRVVCNFRNLPFGIHEEYLFPIPITQKWLGDFEFTKRMINNFFPEFYKDCTPPNYGKNFRIGFWFGMLKTSDRINPDRMFWQPELSGDSHTFPCKYIHQLQNLYFALTGKELEYNE